MSPCSLLLSVCLFFIFQVYLFFLLHLFYSLFIHFCLLSGFYLFYGVLVFFCEKWKFVKDSYLMFLSSFYLYLTMTTIKFESRLYVYGYYIVLIISHSGGYISFNYSYSIVNHIAYFIFNLNPIYLIYVRCYVKFTCFS